MSADGVELGGRAVVKNSIVGCHCYIGDRTKVFNCIVMDHVRIGEG